MAKNTKNLSPRLLNKYLRETLIQEYNLKFDERTMNKILDALQVGMERLVFDGYSFKALGLKFEVYDKPARVYRNVRTGNVELSQAHKALKVNVPRQYLKELKVSTAYKSNERPKLMAVSEEEAKKFLI